MPQLFLLPTAEVADTDEEAAPILRYLMNRGGPLAIDTETTGLDKMHDRVLFWSIATESRRFMFPVSLLYFFAPLFERADIRWYLANAKYDMHMLANHGLRLAGEKWDIIVMDAMEDDTRPHGLKSQAKYAFNADWGEFKNLFLKSDRVSQLLGLDKNGLRAFKKMKGGDKLLFVYDEAPDIVVDYATCDSFFTYMRAEQLAKRLDGEELAVEVAPGFNTLLDYFKVIEVPFTDLLWRMERRGLPADREYIAKIDRPMREGITSALNDVNRILGWRINPKKDEEVRAALFTDRGFGLKPVKYTEGGTSKPVASVEAKVLNLLLSRLPAGSREQMFIGSLLKYKHITKLHNTFVRKLPDLIARDGCIHTQLNQAVARTSRLSSSDPNLQNFPSRNDEFGIRGVFTAPEGRLLVDLDFPQIEFRIAAVLANEEKLMEDIRKGWDIHTANGANMYPDATYDLIEAARGRKDAKQALSDLDKLMLKRRDGAKTAGLAALYGTGANTMAYTLKCSPEEAQGLIDQFFVTYKEIDGLVRFMHDYAHETETTYTMLGRIRRLHTANCGRRALEAQARRQAFNTLIQGSGAEMMKLAMLRVDADPRFQELGGKCALTVHDELLSDAPADTAKEVMEVKRQLMSEPFHWGPLQFDYPVPISPDGSIAFRWSDAK